METKLNSLKAFAFLCVSLLVFSSCSKDDDAQDPIQEVDSQITVETINKSDEMDLVEEEISNIALDILASAEAEATGFAALSDFLPTCAVVAVEFTETSRITTVNFGSGCELPTGNVISGSFTVTFTIDLAAPSKTIELVLSDDFFFNDINVAGATTIVRTFNEAGNPNANKVANYTGTWEDGVVFTYTANKNREWIEGFATGFWGDNVFLLTGNVSFTNALGVTYTKEVTVPLKREWACRFIVSGVLELSRADASVSLDFGDGSCDPFGTLTLPDGSELEIRLRRFLLN